VQYAVGSAMSHRFAAATALGDRAALQGAVRDAVHWTFWPSLAGAIVILALGKPLLGLFGPAFTAGYPAMFVLVIGYLVRSAVGPGEYLLRMSGAQGLSAGIYLVAAIANVVLCFALVPPLGLMGAALGGALATSLSALLNWAAAKRRLGIEIGIWGYMRS
jgi:O-antigen/teichoic acid export membrane protein